MNTQTNQTSKAPSSTDSFFGMALAQAFTGLAFGVDAECIWEAGEVASAIHQDRVEAKAQKRTNGMDFTLGVKQSLSGIFSGLHQSLGETEHAFFKPALSLAQKYPSPSFA
jgi:hypothetical protein